MFDTIKYSLTNGAASVAKAVLFLVLAIVVANLVKGLVLKLIDSTKIKEWLGKLDPEDKKGEIRTFISKLVYLLVFLLFVPAIFSALGMSGIMSPITSILNTIWGYVPNVLAAAIIVAIGSLVAKLVGQIVTKDRGCRSGCQAGEPDGREVQQVRALQRSRQDSSRCIGDLLCGTGSVCIESQCSHQHRQPDHRLYA